MRAKRERPGAVVRTFDSQLCFFSAGDSGVCVCALYPAPFAFCIYRANDWQEADGRMQPGRDYFDILGLPPGRYVPAVIHRAFFAARRDVLERLAAGENYADLCRRLETLHLAETTLGHPESQAAYLATLDGDGGALTRFRQRIAASLEDGLLRCSRRDALLTEARKLGLTDFQTHLLIAHVQFGDDRAPLPFVARGPKADERSTRLVARFAAAGVLGFALFLGMIRWLIN